MAAVLTVNSALACPHQGRLSLSSATGSLTVGGAAVVTTGDVAASSISGCTVVTDASHGLKRCTKVATLTAGASTTLSIAGTPAALDTATGLTDGLSSAGPVQWTVSSAGQTSLTAS